MSLRKFTMAMLLVSCGLFCAAPAKADSLFFSNVKLSLLNVAGPIDLFANPGVVITASNNLPIISMFVSGTPPLGGDILHLTVTATNEFGTFVIKRPDGKEIEIPIDQFTTNSVLGAVFEIPTSFHGTTVTFTVDILNTSPDFIIPGGPNAGQAVNSFTYTFTIIEPAPEPATLVLLTTGIAGIAVRTYRRHRAGRT